MASDEYKYKIEVQAMPRPSKTTIPLAVAERIMKRHGAERIGKDAQEAIAVHCDKYFHIIVPMAVKNADHANRVTVKKTDIDLAVEAFNEGRLK